MKFEYRYEDIQDYPNLHERVFREAMEGGWELVNVFPWNGAFQGQIRFYFKRPIQEGTEGAPCPRCDYQDRLEGEAQDGMDNAAEIAGLR